MRACCNEIHLLDIVFLLYARGMKTFRIAAGIFAVILLALIGYIMLFGPATFEPNTVGELVFLVFGLPVLVVNLWA